MILHRCTLIRRFAPLLAPALVVAALGCREAVESPTAPAAGPALDITPAQALAFRHVSVGSNTSNHNCGVTTDNRAYCWGNNFWGQLGAGDTVAHETPVAVAGGLRFRQVRAGTAHTCGVTTDNRAYCWGFTGDGRLGNGMATGPERCPGGPCSTRPVRVAGGLQFRQVSALGHSCGVTTDNRAYCWGSNESGQLGDGTTTQRLIPVAVAGGLRFLQVSVGASYTCAVNVFDRAFCWGSNSRSQLGDNTTTQRLAPTRVAGGLLFRQVIAGRLHTCGVTTGDQAYCWGSNDDGQLGDGTFLLRRKPAAVAGGLKFRHVVANSSGQVSQQGYTCGVTRADLAYCWGANRYGRLGTGTFERRLLPTPVAGGLQFRQVSVGDSDTCGVTTSDRAYCWGRNVGAAAPVPVAGAS